MAGVTTNDLLDAVRAAGASTNVPSRTEGWQPTRELAKDLKLSMQAVLDRMNKLLAAGLVERRKARQEGSGGNTWYWRLTNRKAK